MREKTTDIKTISRICDYLEWIKECHLYQTPEGLSFQQDRIFYRGQPDKDFNLVPPVFRDQEKNGECFHNEHEILNSAKRTAWKYLQAYPTDLEKMIVLQHYGLHTRLLDFTSNPLIALYFACNNNEDKDGQVFCFCSNGSVNLKYVELIAHAAFENWGIQADINKLLKDWGQTNIGSDDVDAIKYEISKPRFFESPYNNERITAQRGAFIIAPLFDYDKEGVLKRGKYVCKQCEDGVFQPSILVAHHVKKSLLKELMELGIDSSTIFPDFEHLLQNINNADIIKQINLSL